MLFKTGLNLIMGKNIRAFSLKMDALEISNKMNGILNVFNIEKLSRGI